MPQVTLLGQGGLALLLLLSPLFICSVLVVAVILERIWTYSRTGKAPKELLRRIEGMVAAGQTYEAINLLEDYDSPYARIIKASLTRKDASKEEVADALALACEAELALATKPLPVLGTIGNLAPFIGLLGTVLGIVHAFKAIADKGATGMNVVSAGIAEALYTTAFGLGVAIIAVVANNWCNAWVERYRLDLERFSTDWSYRLTKLPQSTAKATEPIA